MKEPPYMQPFFVPFFVLLRLLQQLKLNTTQVTVLMTVHTFEKDGALAPDVARLIEDNGGKEISRQLVHHSLVSLCNKGFLRRRDIRFFITKKGSDAVEKITNITF